MKKLFLTIAAFFLLTCHANAATLFESFDVRIGIFDAAKVSISYTLGPNSAFFAEIKTSGVFDTFYSFMAQYNTSGTFEGNRYTTKGYTQTTKSSSHMRTKTLMFDEKGLLTKRISTKDDFENAFDVAKQNPLPDAYDMQTVLLMMLKKLQTENTCALNKTVFNSKKIYHISIEDEGAVDYQNKKSPYSGKARRCHAFIHQEKVEKGDLLWQVSSERSIIFYVLTDPKTGLFFVPEVNIPSTPLGDLKAFATNYKIKD